MKLFAPIACLIVVAIIGNIVVSTATSAQAGFKAGIDRRSQLTELGN